MRAKSELPPQPFNKSVTRRSAFALAALPLTIAAAVGRAVAQDDAPDPVTPQLRLALTAYVQIGALRSIGDVPGGNGRIIPITGGTFEGPRLSGAILPGGADWQTLRNDGVLELNAHYGLETDDGAIIQVKNRALIPPEPEDGSERRPARSVVTLEAPEGPHDWLNEAVFVGTVNAPPDPRAPVTIRMFEVF